MLYPCTRFLSLKISVFFSEFNIYVNFKIATTQDLIILFLYFAYFSRVLCILHKRVLKGSLHNCKINFLPIAFFICTYVYNISMLRQFKDTQ